MTHATTRFDRLLNDSTLARSVHPLATSLTEKVRELADAIDATPVHESAKEMGRDALLGLANKIGCEFN